MPGAMSGKPADCRYLGSYHKTGRDSISECGGKLIRGGLGGNGNLLFLAPPSCIIEQGKRAGYFKNRMDSGLSKSFKEGMSSDM